MLDKLDQSERADKLFLKVLPKIPSVSPVRQAECYYLAGKRQLHRDVASAKELLKKGDDISQSRGMWGWSSKIKSLLAHSSITTPEETKEYQTLLHQLCSNLPAEQQSLLEDHLYHKAT